MSFDNFFLPRIIIKTIGQKYTLNCFPALWQFEGIWENLWQLWGKILGRRGVHWDEYYRKAIDFPLEHLPIQIVGHRASCSCMELKLDSLCQENRNWSSELPGGPEMGGEYLREREPQQCHPEAKCNNWHEEFNIVFNSKLDTARKRMNKL